MLNIILTAVSLGSLALCAILLYRCSVLKQKLEDSKKQNRKGVAELLYTIAEYAGYEYDHLRGVITTDDAIIDTEQWTCQFHDQGVRLYLTEDEIASLVAGMLDSVRTMSCDVTPLISKRDGGVDTSALNTLRSDKT